MSKCIELTILYLLFLICYKIYGKKTLYLSNNTKIDKIIYYLLIII